MHEIISQCDLEKLVNYSYTNNKCIVFFDFCKAHKGLFFFQKNAYKLYPYHVFCVDGFIYENKTFENLTLLNYEETIYYRSGEKKINSFYNVENIISNYKKIFYLFKQHSRVEIHNRTHQDFFSIEPDTNIMKDCLKKAYIYISLVIKLLDPKYVIIWNMFHPLSQLVKIIARKQKKQIIYAEFGVLPDTICFERYGQVGRSSIALQKEFYDSLSIDNSDLEYAREKCNEWKSVNLGRHKQDVYGSITAEIKKKARGRKIVFYAGHNDLASGTMPYTNTSKKYHSPIFNDSFECAEYLKKIAKKNDWFLLYKPHPLWHFDGLLNDDNFMRIEEANINECIDIADVTCTVLSQISYITLIRGKPLVMLGYNQLKGKNLAFEVYDIENIETVIKNTIERPQNNDINNLFIEHIARLQKYYLINMNDLHSSKYGISSLTNLLI